MKKQMVMRMVSLMIIMLLLGSQMAANVFAGTEETVKDWNKGTYDYVNGESKYSAKAIDLGETTEGITSVVDKENAKITYTIPAGMNEVTININTTKDVQDALEGAYVPGDGKAFSVEIINNSENGYAYRENSFVITTEDLTKHYQQGDPNYSYGETETKGWIEGARGFDGSKIDSPYGINRTANTALKALLGKTSLSSSNKADCELMKDANIAKELKALGYDGLQDLSHYYLDFYNDKYSKNETKLEDFDDSIIKQILSGNRFSNRETCVEIAELGYNIFYNKCLSVAPEGQKATPEYMVGTYMANTEQGVVSAYEDYCKEAFGDLQSGQQGSLKPFQMQLDWSYVANAYQDMEFGFYAGIQLENTTPQYYNDGQITVTKKVTEKGQPYQIINTFYAGLFDDKECTKPTVDADGKPIIIPLELKDQDTVTVTTDNIIPYGDFYVAETDKDGKVMNSSEGHTITIDNPAITVGKDVIPSVTIINEYDEVEGYYKEDDPSSDSTTTTTTTTTTTKENGDQAVQTGDDTTMMPYILLLVLAVGIGGAAIITGRKKGTTK